MIHLTSDQALAIARDVFPDADDTWRWYAIWNATGWPEFWQADPAGELRAQLESARDRLAQGGDIDPLAGGQEDER